jgi:hypothetical protein
MEANIVNRTVQLFAICYLKQNYENGTTGINVCSLSSSKLCSNVQHTILLHTFILLLMKYSV